MIKQGQIKNATFKSGFLYNLITTNRLITLSDDYMQLETFDVLSIMKNSPTYLYDSYIGKWIEASAYSLASFPNNKLESQVDKVINILKDIQQPDGYLNTYYQNVEIENRFTKLSTTYELYCAASLIEGAVAYYITTNKIEFLNIMCRYADLLYTIFGKEKGKLKRYTGHEGISLALVKLYKVTLNKDYLNLAEFFILERSNAPIYFNDNTFPLASLYYLTGLSDIAYLTNNSSLKNICKKVYKQLVSFDFLTLDTCSLIGIAFFMERMFLYEKKGKYIDVLEKIVFSLNTDKPYPRKGLLIDNFCFANNTRFIASLGNYAYATSNEDIYVNLYGNSTFKHKNVLLSQKTFYPYDSDITFVINIDKAKSFNLALRIPSNFNKYILTINKEEIILDIVDGYINIKRLFKNKDELHIQLLK